MIAFEYLAFVKVNATGSITDEWTFADIATASGGEYALVEYAPSVAPRRSSRLGGSGDFAEVVDALTVHCLGGTATQAVAAYERLIAALDAAARWANEETSDVIQLRMRASDGAVGELAAVVLGSVDGDAPATASASWDQAIGAFVVRNVSLRIARRGLLLLPTTTSATSSTVNTGEIMTATHTDNHPTISPARVDITRIDAGTSVNVQGFLLCASEAAQFQIFNAQAAGASDGMTTVADAANFSRSGTVARLTAASSATAMQVSFFSPTIPTRCSTAHVFCNVRPGSAAAAWDLQAVHGDASFVLSEATSRASSIGRRIAVLQSTTVSMLYLGTIQRVEAWTQIMIIAKVTAAAYPQTLDIDTVVVLADDDTTGIIYTPFTVAFNNQYAITADPRPLAGIAPRVTNRDIAADSLLRNLQTTGDSYVQQRGTAHAGLFYGTLSPATAAWRPNIGGSVITMNMRSRRWKGYRVPQ